MSSTQKTSAGLCWLTRKLAPLHNTEQQRELQELTRTRRRFSEQLRADRGALQELMAESAVLTLS